MTSFLNIVQCLFKILFYKYLFELWIGNLQTHSWPLCQNWRFGGNENIYNHMAGLYIRTEGLVKLTIYTITWLAFMLELKVWWKWKYIQSHGWFMLELKVWWNWQRQFKTLSKLRINIFLHFVVKIFYFYFIQKF